MSGTRKRRPKRCFCSFRFEELGGYSQDLVNTIEVVAGTFGGQFCRWFHDMSKGTYNNSFKMLLYVPKLNKKRQKKLERNIEKILSKQNLKICDFSLFPAVYKPPTAPA